MGGQYSLSSANTMPVSLSLDQYHQIQQKWWAQSAASVSCNTDSNTRGNSAKWATNTVCPQPIQCPCRYHCISITKSIKSGEPSLPLVDSTVSRPCNTTSNTHGNSAKWVVNTVCPQPIQCPYRYHCISQYHPALSPPKVVNSVCR